MNIIKYVIDEGYRKRRWASKNLHIYRKNSGFLASRRWARMIQRIMSSHIIFAKLVNRKIGLDKYSIITIPKIDRIIEL